MLESTKRTIDFSMESRAYAVESFYNSLIELGWGAEPALQMTMAYFKGAGKDGK